MRRAGAALGAAALLGLAALAQSCAAVLGVDDASDAVATMCQCDRELGFLGKRTQCEATIAQRIDGASEETRQAWLENFADEKCDECAHVLECYYQKPTCTVGACTSSAECCGGDDGSGYCLQGLCRRKEPDCKHTFEPCTSREECCGNEAALAECHPLGFCVENCSLNDNANCPTCCMSAEVETNEGGTERREVCLAAEDPNCEFLCDPEGEACPGATAACDTIPGCDLTTLKDIICPYVCLP